MQFDSGTTLRTSEVCDNMQYLQTQVPVLFYLLQHLKYIPHKVLNTLLYELINKADAPFLCCSTSTDSDSSVSDFDELSFFRTCNRFVAVQLMLQTGQLGPKFVRRKGEASNSSSWSFHYLLPTW